MRLDLEEDFESERWRLLALVDIRKSLIDRSRVANDIDLEIVSSRELVRSYETLKGYWSNLHATPVLSSDLYPMTEKSSMFLVNPRAAVASKMEARALTSWKDIACYMGKSVRTVQRWERLGLPVRRQSNLIHTASILAYTDELNSWAVDHFSRIVAETENNIHFSQQERLALPQHAQAYIRELEERIFRLVQVR